ncbi:MAG: metallophosphoesterase [Planctomycetota bacterium]
MSCRRRFILVFVIALAPVALLAAWAFVETHLIITTPEVEIPLAGLRAPLDDYRLVLLSDLHVASLGWREQRLLAVLEKLRPQLLLIAGDFVAGHLGELDETARSERLAALAAFARQLVASCEGPVLGVTGNHDDALAGCAALEEAGVRLLCNESVVVETPAGPLRIVGLDQFELSAMPLDPLRDRFEVAEISGSRALVTRSERTNLFCHWVGEGADRAAGYGVEADLLFEKADGGVGVCAGSRIPWDVDRCYRLRRYAGRSGPWTRNFHIATRGTSMDAEHPTTAFRPEAGAWSHVILEVERPDRNGTSVRGAAWPRGEPAAAPAFVELVDPSPSEEVHGTFGFWTMGPGLKAIDNVRVVTLDSAEVIFEESFEAGSDGGLDDWQAGPRHTRAEVAFRGVGAAEAVIVLVHRPGDAEGTAALGADLVLAGDTHGGQINLPGVAAFFAADASSAEIPSGLLATADGVPLYVSRGIGTSILPFRLFCPPEVTCLRLVPALDTRKR